MGYICAVGVVKDYVLECEWQIWFGLDWVRNQELLIIFIGLYVIRWQVFYVGAGCISKVTDKSVGSAGVYMGCYSLSLSLPSARNDKSGVCKTNDSVHHTTWGLDLWALSSLHT